MPKVIEVLVKREVCGQIWTEIVPLERYEKERSSLPAPMENGLRTSPFQKDNFQKRE